MPETLDELSLRVQCQGGAQSAVDVKALSDAIDGVKNKLTQASSGFYLFSTIISEIEIATTAVVFAMYEIAQKFAEFSGLDIAIHIQQFEKQLDSMVKNSDPLIDALRRIGENGFGIDNAEQLATIIARSGGSSKEIAHEADVITRFSVGSGSGKQGAFELVEVLNKIRETPFGTNVSARQLKNIPGVNIRDLLGNAIGIQGDFSIGQAESILSSYGGEKAFALILNQLDRQFSNVSLAGTTLQEKIAVLGNSLGEIFLPLLSPLVNISITIVQAATTAVRSVSRVIALMGTFWKTLTLATIIFFPLVNIYEVIKITLLTVIVKLEQFNVILDQKARGIDLGKFRKSIRSRERLLEAERLAQERIASISHSIETFNNQLRFTQDLIFEATTSKDLYYQEFMELSHTTGDYFAQNMRDLDRLGSLARDPSRTAEQIERSYTFQAALESERVSAAALEGARQSSTQALANYKLTSGLLSKVEQDNVIGTRLLDVAERELTDATVAKAAAQSALAAEQVVAPVAKTGVIVSAIKMVQVPVIIALAFISLVASLWSNSRNNDDQEHVDTHAAKVANNTEKEANHWIDIRNAVVSGRASFGGNQTYLDFVRALQGGLS